MYDRSTYCTYCNTIEFTKYQKTYYLPTSLRVVGKIGQTCFNWKMVTDYLECVLLITVGISSHNRMLRYIRIGPLFTMVTCNTEERSSDIGLKGFGLTE